jgi:hypothetical protein
MEGFRHELNKDWVGIELPIWVSSLGIHNDLPKTEVILRQQWVPNTVNCAC